MIGHIVHWTVYAMVCVLCALIITWQGMNVTDPDPEWTTQQRVWAARLMTIAFGLGLLLVLNWTP